MKTCSNCFLTDQVPTVEINSDGLCKLCAYYKSEAGKADLHKSLTLDRMAELKELAETIKADARAKDAKYDCIIGASGGFDSSYVIYVARKILGLKPLVIKYDNGVVHEMANENLIALCKKLDVDYIIFPALKYERKFFENATRALMNIGVFFSACFSCHYTIASVAYREAQKEKLRYMLTSTNHVEKDFADASHGFMLKSLIDGFWQHSLGNKFKFMFYETKALFYFILHKFTLDKLTLRFFRNLFRLHPVTPDFITKIDISDYIAWNWRDIEKILRGELGWQTPRQTKVPYLRFDCHYSAVIDASFKKITGFTEHAMLINWFVQAGLISKEELKEDFEYMNDDQRVQKEIAKAFDIFGIKQEFPK